MNPVPNQIKRVTFLTTARKFNAQAVREVQGRMTPRRLNPENCSEVSKGRQKTGELRQIPAENRFARKSGGRNLYANGLPDAIASTPMVN